MGAQPANVSSAPHTQATDTTIVTSSECGKIDTPTKVYKPWQIKPGEVRNPHGRPAGSSIREQLHSMLDKGGAAKCASWLFRIAEKGKEHNRIAAIREIADRTEGKPAQSITITRSIDDSTALRLIETLSAIPGMPAMGMLPEAAPSAPASDPASHNSNAQPGNAQPGNAQPSASEPTLVPRAQ